MASNSAGKGSSLSRQSTSDTDIDTPSCLAKKSHDGSFSMSPSTSNLLLQLDAANCIGCSLRRSKVLEEALTYCRIPGYELPCSEDGWSPLLIATQRRHCDAVETLLQHGAKPDCREPESGWTPLMFAASLGDADIAKMLIDHGAEVNAFASPHDWNPLCAAIQSNNGDIVRMLIDAGADIGIIKRRHPELADTYASEIESMLEEYRQ